VCYFQRYCYYIEKGIKKEMLAEQPPEVMARMKNLIPDYLLENPKLGETLSHLEEEVDANYEFSLRKCIGLRAKSTRRSMGYSPFHLQWISSSKIKKKKIDFTSHGFPVRFHRGLCP
jgi:hypothetical protein